MAMRAASGAAQPLAPGPTNVVVLSKIPEGITEQQVAAGAGRHTDVLQVSFRAADLDGPGWAIIAFASPELAKAARERLEGKPFPGQIKSMMPLDAALGEGLFGNMQSNDQDSPWKEARTSMGQVYYYHVVTRQTSWTKPMPEFHQVNTVAGQLSRLVQSGRSLNVLANATPGQQAQAAIQAAQAAVQQASGGGNLGGDTQGPIGANLFVYHIPTSWDDNILRQHFEHFGTIVSCRVQKDDNGRSRGFGFISYDDQSAAQAAIAGMHGFPVEGKWLKVQLKKGDEQQLSDKAAVPNAALAGVLAEAGGPTPHAFGKAPAPFGRPGPY